MIKEEVSQFQNVVKRHYYYKFYIDDLPIWGFIGWIKMLDLSGRNERYFLCKHLHFEVHFNKDRVIQINLTTESVMDLPEDRGLLVDFSYDVKWKETDTILEERMKMYLPYFSSLDHLHIRWNLAGNTFVMILILTGGLVTFYMRVLKKNFME